MNPIKLSALQKLLEQNSTVDKGQQMKDINKYPIDPTANLSHQTISGGSANVLPEDQQLNAQERQDKLDSLEKNMLAEKQARTQDGNPGYGNAMYNLYQHLKNGYNPPSDDQILDAIAPNPASIPPNEFKTTHNHLPPAGGTTENVLVNQGLKTLGYDQALDKINKLDSMSQQGLPNITYDHSHPAGLGFEIDPRKFQKVKQLLKQKMNK